MVIPTPSVTRQDRFRGLLLGTAVGDALGLPSEGLSPQRAKRIFGARRRHHLMLRRGMISDDTEHALMVANCLLRSPGSAEQFRRQLATSLRWWVASLPPGIGMATLQSVLRLWLGFPPTRSGVRSAGSAPATRAAPIGACFASAPGLMDAYVGAATTLTHRDPRALIGAAAVARLVAWTVRENPRTGPGRNELIHLLRSAGPDNEEWSSLIRSIVAARDGHLPVDRFAQGLGLERGVSGFVFHTVPVAVYAWLRHFGDFEATLCSVLDCGGDTDTTGAIAGALAGALVGESGIPRAWVDGILDWPRSPAHLRAVADRLCGHAARLDARDALDTPDAAGAPGPVRLFWPALPVRNLFQLGVVLVHGVRRLLPPY
jgi:ADP-ribosylglycohydrolase